MLGDKKYCGLAYQAGLWYNEDLILLWLAVLAIPQPDDRKAISIMPRIIRSYTEKGKCSGCNELTEVTTYLTANKKLAPFSLCPQCQETYPRRQQKAKSAYLPVTVGQYSQMHTKQNGLCAVCGKPENAISRGGTKRGLAIDHNHKTGAVRGLLCNRCNIALGLLEDDPERCEAMARYLKDYL